MAALILEQVVKTLKYMKESHIHAATISFAENLEFIKKPEDIPFNDTIYIHLVDIIRMKLGYDATWHDFGLVIKVRDLGPLFDDLDDIFNMMFKTKR